MDGLPEIMGFVEISSHEPTNYECIQSKIMGWTFTFIQRISKILAALTRSGSICEQLPLIRKSSQLTAGCCSCSQPSRSSPNLHLCAGVK